MALIANCLRRVLHELLLGVSRGVRHVAIDTTRRIRVRGLPLPQVQMKMIVESTARDRIVMALDARIIV